MEGSTSSIIFIALITTLLVVFNYRTMRFKKNVADIVQQILAHNKRDRMLRNQEFLHYFLSSGNIWLAHMDEDFRKTVMVQTGVSVLSIVGGLALIAACVFCEVYPLAIYPAAMLVFAWKVGFSFETISKDEKVNARRAMENYKKQYPNDPTVKQNKCTDKSPAWYMTAKKLARPAVSAAARRMRNRKQRRSSKRKEIKRELCSAQLFVVNERFRVSPWACCPLDWGMKALLK